MALLLCLSGPVFGASITEQNSTQPRGAAEGLLNDQDQSLDPVKVEIISAPKQARPGDEVTVEVKITNLSGHNLPTGFAEGRQMWLHSP